MVNNIQVISEENMNKELKETKTPFWQYIKRLLVRGGITRH